MSSTAPLLAACYLLLALCFMPFPLPTRLHSALSALSSFSFLLGTPCSYVGCVPGARGAIRSHVFFMR
jgi:hypothetical protein